MDSNRWDRIQSVFHGAADLPKSQQRAFLESACADDESLIADIQALLDEDAKDSSLLNRNMADIASEVLDDPASHRFPFKEFGPYRIVRVLGEGGMGVVFLAERRDLHSQVAIKILRDAWVSPARRERFSSEQRTLAQLNHPSIARLYDADTLPDGTPLFVMEYVEGCSIVEYCKKLAYPFDWARARDDLGGRWESRAISFEPYPTGHVAHAFIDAALQLRAEGVRAEDIERVVCPIAEFMAKLMCEPRTEKLRPATTWHARVSLPVTLAEAFLYGKVDAASFGAERLRDPHILALAERITHVIDVDAPGREQWRGWVQITLKDGSRRERIQPYNWGSVQSSLSQADIDAKFRANAGGGHRRRPHRRGDRQGGRGRDPSGDRRADGPVRRRAGLTLTFPTPPSVCRPSCRPR